MAREKGKSRAEYQLRACIHMGRWHAPCNPLTCAAVEGEVGSVPRVFTTYIGGEKGGGDGGG